MALPSLTTGDHAASIGGRYRVERLLGQGGMAAVYAAVDSATGARVALKRLAANASSKVQSLFEREYRTLSGLRHPCIVEVYDYAPDDAGAYYTMELVDGHELSRDAPLPWREACAYLRDAASILGLLHAHRLIHRDLSPRNLLVGPSGRLKLIDFGALAPFGIASELVGTPPFVPPEALHGEALDQRSDLFALGALGYWLISGRHAYPARSLDDLPQLHQHEPPPLSTEVAPQALDELLSALVRVDPRERPHDTAELIDRLNLIAELPPEAAEVTTVGYLASPAFVGRERERERFEQALRAGRMQVLVIESEPGLGRTRLLQELAVQARLAGALTLELDAARERKPYALAEALLLQLTTPVLRAALGSHAPQLARLSRALREKLQVEPAPEPRSSPTEQRARIQHALLEVVLAVARQRPLALIVDDLQEADEESQALLAALAHAGHGTQLCLVGALVTDPRHEHMPAVHSLRNASQRLRLAPLTASEVHELLRSLFGDVPYLERLSERLFRASEGHPAYALELARHLVRSGAARYLEGAWSLPMLAEEQLPANRQAGVAAQLDAVPEAARALARTLSTTREVWSLSLACAASELAEAQARELLAELERQHVLRAYEQGHRFANDTLRETLHGELDTASRARVHARVAEALLAGAAEDDITTRLRACVHFLRAGRLERAYPILSATYAAYIQDDLGAFAAQAPQLEQIHTLLREAGQDDHALAGPLALLSVAGYMADRRYAERYGEQTLACMRRVLSLDLVPRLSPWLGAKLALIATLAVALGGIVLRGRRALPLKLTLRLWLASLVALTGVASTCLDSKRAARYAQELEPFAVLGPDRVTRVVYQLLRMLPLAGRDQPARTVSALHELLERLDGRRPIHDLPDVARINLTAACMLVRGVNQAWYDRADALATADQLERVSPLHAMGADQLRAMYHGGQGDLEGMQTWLRRMEVHAVQLGSAWQVETWACSSAVTIALRTQDATRMKRALRDLERLAVGLPSLAPHLASARAGYMLLRGKPQQVLEILEEAPYEPGAIVGGLRTRGMLAQAYNELGQHARARAVCVEALRHADEEALARPVYILGLQLELVRAEAGLGQYAQAHALLMALRERQDGVLTRVMLHEAQAQLAVAEGQLELARAALQAMSDELKPLALPGWNLRVRAISRRLHPTREHAEPTPGKPMLTVTERGRRRGERTVRGRRTRRDVSTETDEDTWVTE